MTLKVVDEVGNPVPHVNAGVGFFTNSQPASIDGITDTNGLFVASQTVEPSGGGYTFGFSAEKDGYYTTRSGFYLDAKYDAVKWNPTVTLTLKKVGKPVAMCAKRVGSGPPVFNEQVGYDLIVGDWVGPHGKGITADIIFFGKLDQKSRNDFDYELTIKFPKKDDGIQEFVVSESEKGSGLRSPHAAPDTGYQEKVVKSMHHHPGLGARDDMNDPNRNYFFRVRTIKNDDGKIVSAHYGKIYGDFMQFSYYLNPTPNSRNVEFDPNKNLFKNISDSQQVKYP